jgi:hypothetical protein
MNRDASCEEPRCTSEPPTEPGWYWCYEEGKDPYPEFRMPAHPTRPAPEPGRMWCGPILPPPAAPPQPEGPVEVAVAVASDGDLNPVVAGRSLGRGRTPN